MATGSSKEGITLSRVVQEQYDTICEELDVKEVVDALAKEDLPPKLQRRIKKIIGKENEAERFYSVLRANFDLGSFLIFLNVLEASHNEKHTLIHDVLCSQLEYLSLDSETDQDVRKEVQQKITSAQEKKAKHLASTETKAEKESTTTVFKETDTEPTAEQQTTTVETIVLYPIEAVTFTRTNGAILYSDTHGITVSVPPEAFPEHVDSLIVSGSVNSSSQPITLPDHCKGMYTPLVSLTCEPRIHAFMDFVMVTIPHCAVGNFADNLCVVTAADDMFELTEDPTIEIESIDQHYITFKTKHFTKFLGSSSRKRKQRRRKKKGLHLPSKSLDEHTAQSPVPIPRSYSSPPAVERDLDARCCAFMCTSPQQSKRILFLVTLDLPTHWKELEEFASNKFECGASPDKVRSAFTFSQDFIHFKPESKSKEGWKILSLAIPPTVAKKDVQLYRTSQYIPAVEYARYASDSPQTTDFKITLEGSKSILSEPISFCVFCDEGLLIRPTSTINEQETVNIISDLYDQDSPIRTLNEEFLLTNDNRDCKTLFCEISFHLPKWQEISRILKMMGSDKDTILQRQQMQIIGSHEAAYEMLETWVRKSLYPPKLGTLIAALSRVGIRLELSSWRTNYHIQKPTVELTRERIAPKIKHHWQILARLLGEDVESIQADYCHESVEERACKMLVHWQRHCPQGYSRLVDAVQCIYEHTGHCRDLLWSFVNHCDDITL